MSVIHIEMNKIDFNIAHIEDTSEIYGPGSRMVIWFQGCTLNCEGCWNKEFQTTLPNTVMSRSDLFNMIVMAKADGVTFLGGEPLQQSENLLWLVRKLKGEKIHIMLYTGYELNEIESNPIFREICDFADILIPGRYKRSLRNTNLTWRGSENQPILIRDGVSNNPVDVNQVEMSIDDDGKVVCLGYPDASMREYLSKMD